MKMHVKLGPQSSSLAKAQATSASEVVVGLGLSSLFNISRVVKRIAKAVRKNRNAAQPCPHHVYVSRKQELSDSLTICTYAWFLQHRAKTMEQGDSRSHAYYDVSQRWRLSLLFSRRAAGRASNGRNKVVYALSSTPQSRLQGFNHLHQPEKKCAHSVKVNAIQMIRSHGCNSQ